VWGHDWRNAFPTHEGWTHSGPLSPSSREEDDASAQHTSGSRGPDAPVAAALTPTLRPWRLSCRKTREQLVSPPPDRSDGRHRSLRCRGDLTSRCPHGHQVRFSTWRGHECRACAAPCGARCVASIRLPSPACSLSWIRRPCGRRIGCLSILGAGAGRTNPPRDPAPGGVGLLGGTSSLAGRERLGHPLERGGRTGGRLRGAIPPTLPTTRRGASVQPRLPVGHLHEAGSRLSSGHSCGSSTILRRGCSGLFLDPPRKCLSLCFLLQMP